MMFIESEKDGWSSELSLEYFLNIEYPWSFWKILKDKYKIVMHCGSKCLTVKKQHDQKMNIKSQCWDGRKATWDKTE